MNESTPCDRAKLLERLARAGVGDLAVIGGGSTGLGIALDAASRGLSVVLVERSTLRKERRRVRPNSCTVACGIWRKATSG